MADAKYEPRLKQDYNERIRKAMMPKLDELSRSGS